MSTSGAGVFISPVVQDAVAIRSAGADTLSLALMDARTRTLGWLAVFEGLDFSRPPLPLDPPLWLVGQCAWHQEYWVARHLQRGRGAAADPHGPRLASTEPRADAWFKPQASAPEARWGMALPDGQALRAYLQATLDATLELLDKADGSAEALHVFRETLHHEDLLGQTLAELAQALDLPAERHAQALEAGLWQPWRSPVRRPPVGLPGQHLVLGAQGGCWAPETEQGLLELVLPGVEMDAQAVSWAEFSEFVDDGGYDHQAWWSAEGWRWVQTSLRRAPRYVEQLAGGVLAKRQGRMQRLPAGQPVLHVSAHEADAWCNWAGRRLPSNAEWSLAVRQAAGQGWVWGEVQEWVAGQARAYPGGPAPQPGAQRTLRGSSVQASPRLRHPDARQFVPAAADWGFAGFRSCAV